MTEPDNNLEESNEEVLEDFSEKIDEKPINMLSLLKAKKPIEEIAIDILEGTWQEFDIYKRDAIDKFIDFVVSTVNTGELLILNLEYPTKRIRDRQLEKKIIELINDHMFPEIVMGILKFFSRNIHDSDRNLYLAYLITSEDIIRSIYNTFIMFRNDIYETNLAKRVLNVKRIQQFSPTTAEDISSPLDAAARFKYILEYIAYKENVDNIYKKEDLLFTDVDK